jgi:sugar phosphate permease
MPRASASTDETSAPGSGYRWVISAVLFVGVTAAFFDRISISVLFTNTDFQNAMGTGFNPSLLGLLMTTFLFAYGASSILLSFVGDVFGPRRCLLVGTITWGIAMAFMGSAGSFAFMLGCRIFLGVAEGPQFSISAKLTRRWFAPSEYGRATALWMIGSPLGSMIGFPLSFYLVDTYGWRGSFYGFAAINLLLILPMFFFLLRDQPAHGPVAATTQDEKRPFKASVAALIGDWRFWMLTLSTSGSLVYLWGLNSWLPSYLIRERHFDPRESSLFAALPFLLTIFGEMIGGYVADRTGRYALVSAVALAMAGALMYFVATSDSAYVAVALISASTFFWGACTSTKNALGVKVLPPGALSTGVGLYNGIANIAGAFAPVAMGALIGTTGNYQAGFLVIVGSAILGSATMVPLIVSDNMARARHVAPQQA